MSASSNPTINHDAVASRFLAVLEGHEGALAYRREGGRMVIPSVVVDPAIEGRGVAGALTRAALDWARAQGLKVDPVCPYVVAWMRRHSEYDDLR